MSAPKLLGIGLVVTAALATAWAAPTGRPMVAASRFDRAGDLLPAGAIARIGTLRFRGDLRPGPDGVSLLTLRGNRATLIDPESGRELRRYPGPDPLEFEAWSALVSPNGQYVAYSGRHVVEVWDVATGRRLHQFGEKDADHNFRGDVGVIDQVIAFAFSPDSTLLVTSSPQGFDRCRCWDLQRGEQRWKIGIPAGGEFMNMPVGFTDGGASFVSLRQKGATFEAVTAAAATGETISAFDIGGNPAVYAMPPGGRELAVAGRNGSIRRFELATGRELKGAHLGGGDYEDFEYTHDGKGLITIDFAGIHVWDLATNKEIVSFRAERMEEPRIVVAKDGKTVWVTDRNQPVWRKLDLAQKREIKLSGSGHQSAINSLAVSPDGRTLATASTVDGTRLWESDSGVPLRRLLRQPLKIMAALVDPGVNGLTFAPDGNSLAAVTADNRIVFWEPSTGNVRKTMSFGDDALAGEALALSPDGKLMAVAQISAINNVMAYTARLFDVASGKVIRKLPPQGGQIAVLAFSPDSRLLMKGSRFGEDEQPLMAFDVTTGKVARAMPCAVHAARFLPHGCSVLYSSIEDELVVWEGLSGGIRLQLARPDDESINLLAVSTDGRLAAGASNGNGYRHIYLWDLRTGQRLKPLVGHEHHIIGLAFAGPDRLVSTSQDTTALVWDLRDRIGPGVPPPADRDAAWTALAAGAAAAHPALEGLATDPSIALQVLSARLKPAATVDPARIRQLLARLDAERFADRQRALTELEQLDLQAEPLLREHAESAVSPEARQRATRLLERLDSPAGAPERLRELRCLELLERLATPEAIRLIEELSTGDPAARLTRAARDTLLRFKKP